MNAQTPPSAGSGYTANVTGHAPPGYGTLTPWVISRDTARLIDFVRDAFDAEELARFPDPDGRIGHAEVRIGNSVVMMFDSWPGWPATPGFLRLYVADADQSYQRAMAARGHVGYGGDRAVLR